MKIVCRTKNIFGISVFKVALYRSSYLFMDHVSKSMENSKICKVILSRVSFMAFDS